MSAAPAKKKTTSKPNTRKPKKAPTRPAETLSTRRAPPRSQARAVPPSRGGPRRAASAAQAANEESAAKAAAPSTGPVEVCPSCGTTTFGPEERTRWEGRRTVRFTVLVCERGHTFAHPVPRPA